MNNPIYEETLEVDTPDVLQPRVDALVLRTPRPTQQSTPVALDAQIRISERLPRLDGYTLSQQRQFRMTMVAFTLLIFFAWSLISWFLYYAVHI